MLSTAETLETGIALSYSEIRLLLGTKHCLASLYRLVLSDYETKVGLISDYETKVGLKRLYETKSWVQLVENMVFCAW